jgi:uncharacterized protein (DUF58 family)
MLIGQRRIYILPTRLGLMMAALLFAMLIAGLNYNSNLGLAFTFLMVSLGLVAMHHCHRNLLGLGVDLNVEVDAFAGGDAAFDFMLRNQSLADRCDIEVRCTPDGEAVKSVSAQSYAEVRVNVPVTRRGVRRWDQFELGTRYPFGWFRAWTYVQASFTAYVAPAPGGERPLPPAAAASGAATGSETRGDEEFAGLRPYAPGVPLKYMAWKVLARGGDAAVRSYTDLVGQPQWLEWSSLEGLSSEARLSQLCRWVLKSEAVFRHAYGLRIPGSEIPPARGAAHRLRCLRALAAYPAEKP